MVCAYHMPFNIILIQTEQYTSCTYKSNFRAAWTNSKLFEPIRYTNSEH